MNEKWIQMYLRDPGGQYSFVDLQNPVIASSCNQKSNQKENWNFLNFSWDASWIDM